MATRLISLTMALNCDCTCNATKVQINGLIDGLRLEVSELQRKAKAGDEVESKNKVEFEHMKEEIRRGQEEASRALKKAVVDFREQ